MKRQEAREYFSNCGLSYKDKNPPRLRMLLSMLNEAFSKEEQTAIKDGVTPYWVRANDDKTFKAKFGDDGLICAYITGKGGYFNAREAISFNPDGFIGFCGEASAANAAPVLETFVKWCDYVKEATP